MTQDSTITAEAEQALLERIRSGDRTALSTLLSAYQSRLYNVCLRMLSNRDDAAEATQEAMLKILNGIDGFRRESGLATWMIRIAMNESISALRRRRVRRTLSLDQASSNGQHHDGDDTGSTLQNLLQADGELEPLRRVQRGELLDHLREAIGELDEPFRAVIVLRDIDGLEYEQIAEVLELPVGTVKSRLFRARLCLREQVRKRRKPESLAADASPRPARTDNR